MTGAARVRPNRGWAVLAVAFLGQMCTIGSVSYGYGLLVGPLTAEFGLSRASANGGLMLLIVGMGLCSPLIGRLLDRVPVRRVVLGGAMLFALGCVGVSRSPSLWPMIVAALAVAAGAAALGPLTASTLAVRWFDRDRGKALGIVAVSSSAGGLVMLPIMAVLLRDLGWRGLVMTLGLAIGSVIAVLAIIVIRERPRAARAAADAVATLPAEAGHAVATLFRTRDFWLLAIGFGVVQGVDQALLVTIIPYATDRGFDLIAASLLMSVISGSAIAGKLLIGWLADHVDRRRLFCGLALLTAAFLAFLLSEPAYRMLLGTCLIVGAAVGGTTPLWGALIVERFGSASYATVLGLLIPLQMPITIGCLQFIGHAYDRTGNYSFGFTVFIPPVILVGMLMLWLARPPQCTAPRERVATAA